jgi:mono/diheme cytochrome c family protein
VAERGDCSQRLWGSSGRRQDAPVHIVLLAVVTNGKGAMPAWRGDLTAKEIRKVVEYTRTGLGQ